MSLWRKLKVWLGACPHCGQFYDDTQYVGMCDECWMEWR